MFTVLILLMQDERKRMSSAERRGSLGIIHGSDSLSFFHVQISDKYKSSRGIGPESTIESVLSLTQGNLPLSLTEEKNHKL